GRGALSKTENGQFTNRRVTIGGSVHPRVDIGAGVNLEACEQPTRSPVARVSQPPARPRARGARGRAGLWARRGSVHPRPEHSKKVAPPAGGGKRRLKEPHANPAPTPHDFWGGGRGSLRSGAPERSEPHPPPQKSWGVGVGFACGPP
ncbi:unnamed protein product, partial [Prorocentrum cordatum]